MVPDVDSAGTGLMPPLVTLSAWSLARWMVAALLLGIIAGLVVSVIVPGPGNPLTMLPGCRAQLGHMPCTVRQVVFTDRGRG